MTAANFGRTGPFKGGQPWHRRPRARQAQAALGTVDPTPYFAKYKENLWAAVKGYLDAVAETAAAPVIEKYAGVLGARV